MLARTDRERLIEKLDYPFGGEPRTADEMLAYFASANLYFIHMGDPTSGRDAMDGTEPSWEYTGYVISPRRPTTLELLDSFSLLLSSDPRTEDDEYPEIHGVNGCVDEESIVIEEMCGFLDIIFAKGVDS